MKRPLLIVLCAIVLSCSSMYAQQRATIHFERIDSTVDEIEYQDVSPFEFSQINNDFPSVLSRKNGVFNLRLSLQSPRLINIYPPGQSGSQFIFVSPNDSVVCHPVATGSKNYMLIFTGRNAAHYNYDAYIHRAFPSVAFPCFYKGDNGEHYKQILLAYKAQQTDMLMKYIGNNQVTEDFIRYAKAEIQNEYIWLLYRPIQEQLIDTGHLPAHYLSDNQIVSNAASHYYYMALVYKYIYCYTGDPLSHFELVSQNVRKNLAGNDRAYLWSAMIGYYALGQRQSYRALLLKAIQDASLYVGDKNYLAYINRSKEFYEKTTLSFPDSVADKTLLKSLKNNGTITLRQLLNQFANTALYLDCWASWCAPCKKDIENSHPAKAYLNAKNIAYIYFSIDNNETQWKQCAQKYNITDNQYLIINDKESPLAKYLNLNMIPRYVLLDTNHQIFSISAPRPTSENNFQELKDAIEMLNKQNSMWFNFRN